MCRRTLILTVLLAGGALLVGAGIGHELWRPAVKSAAQVQPGGGSGATGAGGSSYGYGSGGSSNGNSSPYGYGSGGSSNGNGSPYAYGSGGSSSGSSSGGSGGPSNVSSIAAAVDPGLVDLNVTLGDQNEQASATGIVLTSSGLVLTNNHVIDGATTISATDVGNGKTYRATVVGYDRSADIAVIQLSGASGLKTSALGDSSKVTIGDTVVAIGNAGGVGGTPSAAGGSVVALNQQITATDEDGGSSERLGGLIEVNADVQSGDSGGPLVNSAGRVIGVDAAASAGFSFRSSGGQGYAIPINRALAIAAQIENNHSSASVHIGPTAFLGVKLSYTASRATIVGVLSGSPAARAGLGSGCVITSLAGQAVDSPTTLVSLLGRYRPKDRVRLGWSDPAGQRHAATVQLAAGPAQ